MSDWQPIETAPEGVDLLGWTGKRIFVGQKFDGAQGFTGVRGALIDARRGAWVACTHWMLQPKPPEPTP